MAREQERFNAVAEGRSELGLWIVEGIVNLSSVSADSLDENQRK